jgi:hypothetical protein
MRVIAQSGAIKKRPLLPESEVGLQVDGTCPHFRPVDMEIRYQKSYNLRQLSLPVVLHFEAPLTSGVSSISDGMKAVTIVALSFAVAAAIVIVTLARSKS